MRQDAAREALNAVEDYMCLIYHDRDTVERKILYVLCYAVRLLLLDKLKEIKRGANERG